MLITIRNNHISFTVDTLGAQPMSLKNVDGVEYLWQGDPKYWADRSPTLFPYIGRLTNGSYRYFGKEYPMSLHGFAAAEEFKPVKQTEDVVTLELVSNEQTRKSYPFAFTFRVTYSLRVDTVNVRMEVINQDEKVMPFAVGGHPGFNVPLVDGECFEDYVLEFSHECYPDRIGFSPTVYMNGIDPVYPLEDNKRILLKHDLFDDDAIILRNMGREVTLKSLVSGHGVQVAYPDLPYIGFWHRPKTDAPFVCIEPWSSLPSRQDVVEDIAFKGDMLQLKQGCTYDTTWTIRIF